MAMNIDKDAIRELAELLNETSLTEIEVADGDRKIRVARTAAQTVTSVPAPVFPIELGAPQQATHNIAHPVATPASHPGAVVSPMVGTAYLAAEPGKAPFVSVGAKVKAGDTLLIIEAMKVMNPIKAEKGGTVTQILIEDARPVEFGDVMMVIE